MSRRLQVIQIKDCEFGSVEYRAGGRYGPAVQEGYQLMIVNRGFADVIDDQGSFRIGAGSCAFLPIDQRFRIRFAPNQISEHAWCLLSREYVESNRISGLSVGQVVGVSQQINLLISAALEMEERDFDDRPIYLARLAECVFREYLRLTLDNDRTSVEERVDRALDLMNRRLHDPLSVPEIAQKIGMSRQHFSKVFREIVGRPVAQYLWELRVKKAHALLCQTGLSLAEIAEHTGFQNPFHLSRRVKAFYGHSPSAIRRGLE